MKNQVTFGHALTILAIFIFPSLIWIKNVEVRLVDVSGNKEDIIEIKKTQEEKIKSDNANFLLVLEKLHEIDLKLKDKEDK